MTNLHEFASLRSLNLGYNNFNGSPSTLGTYLQFLKHMFVINVFYIYLERKKKHIVLLQQI